MQPLAALILLLVVGITGCSPGARPAPPQPAPAQPPAAQLDETKARQALIPFLEAKIKGDAEAYQYGVLRAAQASGGWLFSVTESYRRQGQVWARTDRTDYLVENREGKTVVVRYAQSGGHTKDRSVESYPSKQNPPNLQVRADGTEKVALTPAQLPNEFRPHGAGPDISFGVGKDGWAAVAVAPDLSRVAFVTRGTHAFLGIANLEIGKVQGLDLWFGGGGSELAWSPDSEWLAASRGTPAPGSILQVWNVADGSLRKAPGVPEGPEIFVTDLHWRNGVIHFQVKGESWSFDPRSGRAGKD